ncbi:MAG: hypothetical protein ACYCPO_16400 [Acidobacteriaceae bacterium]
MPHKLLIEKMRTAACVAAVERSKLGIEFAVEVLFLTGLDFHFFVSIVYLSQLNPTNFQEA